MQLPQSLIQSLQKVKGFDEAAFLAVHASGGQLTSVRRNPKKSFDTGASVFNETLESVPWSSNGFYLPERPSFTLDPLFHAGAYYVQEASSMFLEAALRQTLDFSAPLTALDLCAAPGGKSTLLQSMLSDESLLVSNEVIKTRVNILAENITKWGAANVIVTNNDPRDFQRLEGFFDLMVVDAPCSGSGLFRKDPDAISEWSENNVELCSQRQQRILADVLPALKPGGVLIYSTCSYSVEEDEDIVNWLHETQGLSSLHLQTDPQWGIVETETNGAYGYRFYPDKVKGEGFFIAAFKKETGDAYYSQASHSKKKSEKLSAKQAVFLQNWLDKPADYFFINQRDEVIAMPQFMEKNFFDIQHALYIKKAGIKMGTLIRDELVPDHELAVSTAISPAVRRLNVDLETARQYLRREDIAVETADKGWALLCYGQLPLGWVKVLPNRINNYYPREWRILNK